MIFREKLENKNTYINWKYPDCFEDATISDNAYVYWGVDEDLREYGYKDFSLIAKRIEGTILVTYITKNGTELERELDISKFEVESRDIPQSVTIDGTSFSIMVYSVEIDLNERKVYVDYQIS